MHEKLHEGDHPKPPPAGPWTRMPPPDPTVEMALLLQDGIWSPSRQKEVRAGERGRPARPRGGQGTGVPTRSNVTRSNDAYPNWFSPCGMPRLSCLLVILEIEQ